jgi:hypothetical protein
VCVCVCVCVSERVCVCARTREVVDAGERVRHIIGQSGQSHLIERTWQCAAVASGFCGRCSGEHQRRRHRQHVSQCIAVLRLRDTCVQERVFELTVHAGTCVQERVFELTVHAGGKITHYVATESRSQKTSLADASGEGVSGGKQQQQVTQQGQQSA